MKLLPISERQRAEFRTEFFNAFNQTNFANPVSTGARGPESKPDNLSTALDCEPLLLTVHGLWRLWRKHCTSAGVSTVPA